MTNFWKMTLDNYYRKIISQINDTIGSKLVNIERPENLTEAHAQIAKILQWELMLELALSFIEPIEWVYFYFISTFC